MSEPMFEKGNAVTITRAMTNSHGTVLHPGVVGVVDEIVENNTYRVVFHSKCWRRRCQMIIKGEDLKAL